MPPVAAARCGQRVRFVAGIPSSRFAVPAGAVRAAVEVSVGERRRHYGLDAYRGEPFTLLSTDLAWHCAPQSNRFANWLAVGETITFTGTPPQDRTGLRTVLRDSAGRVVCDETGTDTWRWTPTRPGFYEAEFFWREANGSETPASERLILHDIRYPKGVSAAYLGCEEVRRSRQAIAVAAAGPIEPDAASPTFGFHLSPAYLSPFFTNTQYRLPKLLGMSSFIRYAHINHGRVEPTRGRFDWSEPDRTFAAAEEHGYPPERMLVQLFGSAEWNTTAKKPYRIGPYQSPANYAPKDVTAWRDFVTAVLRRYPRIRAVELWNEPHLPGYSVFWQDSSPEQFVDLLKNGYEAVKAVDPSVSVMLGGVGMRYQPFYERLIALGGWKYFDQVGTHCGYRMDHFRDTETRHGAPHKPYFENEWHTVLYNCRDPQPPDEEACAYRMLVNLATLLHGGMNRIAGFGLVCRSHVPESAKFYARADGVQQVYGLFRSHPFLEPRLAALALRTATDRFNGEVKPLGAWGFGEDAAQRVAVFESAKGGRVGFVWNANARHPAWWPAVKSAGSRLLDWEGRPTTWDDMKPKRVFFLLDPDLEVLKTRGVPLERLAFTNASGFSFEQPPAQAKYRIGGVGLADAGLDLVAESLRDDARRETGDEAIRFAAGMSAEGLTVVFETRGTERLKEVRGALDVEGRGELEDVLEVRATVEDGVVKTRMPQISGDIPVEWSEAGTRLARSRLEKSADGRRWLLQVGASDLYPYVHAPGRRLRAHLAATTESGRTVSWGDGWGTIKTPARFGVLAPSAGGRVLATLADVRQVFQDAVLERAADGVRVRATSGTRGAGFVLPLAAAAGTRLRIDFVASGNCELKFVLWPKGANGRIFAKLDQKPQQLTEREGRYSLVVDVPENASSVDLGVLVWQQADAAFLLRSFRVENE